ncbi:MAG: transcriptional repressor [Chloroflexi bacterium]|nr:transcriptional repressor [Chloroflexota bacterium]
MLRRTKQKEAILEVLRGTTSHPTADWVYNEVRKEIPNISLGTVYRNLRLLCERGEILELDLCGTLARFDARQDNHYHFRCEKCGWVFDVDLPVDEEIDRRAAQKTGFEVSFHRLEFRGVCKNCQGS